MCICISCVSYVWICMCHCVHVEVRGQPLGVTVVFTMWILRLELSPAKAFLTGPSY